MSSFQAPISLLVTAALLQREGMYLLAKRPKGKHLAGHWEFPGGKVQVGEEPPAALRRELIEELDIQVLVQDLYLDHTHAYPDRTVRLLTYRCHTSEEPKALEHEALAWVRPAEMGDFLLSPADREVVALLQQEEE